MTQTISAREFLRLAAEKLSVLKEAYEAAGAAIDDHQKCLDEIERARESALTEFIEYCMPDLNRDSVARVAACTGYHRFETDDPITRIGQRRLRLQKRVQEIEADDRYIGRDHLIDPNVGELILERDNLAGELSILDPSLARYEQDPSFRELHNRRYGTDDYSGRWWSRQYYRDWKAGDEVLERFNENDFKVLIRNHDELDRARQALAADLEQVDERIASVKALVDERESALSSIETVETDVLAECRGLLREHLEYIDRAELAQRLENNEPVLALVKRLQGIEKKKEYLDELAGYYLNGERGRIVEAITSLEKKLAKYQRPKYVNSVIPAEQAASWLKDVRPKMESRQKQFNKVYQEVYYFDRYDSFDFARDILWWDLMTRNRYEGSFIPEVQSWRTSHPAGYSPYEGDLDRANAAMSQSLVGPEGDDSLTEVS